MNLLGGFNWKRIGRFGDDDPSDEIGDGADSGEEDEERSEDADEGHVPAVVDGEACADSSDDAVGSRAGELARDGVGTGRGRRWCCDGGSAVRTETG
jgi:hypothetical protein